MKRGVLLVLGSILVSIFASALLGRVALRITPFGHMIREMSRETPGATTAQAGSRYGDPIEVTLQMLRLTTFILDPTVAILTGFLVGLWGGKNSANLAALGILPLAAFSFLSYPWLWAGIAAGIIDLLFASGTAFLTSRYRGKRLPA
jgi:Na+/H+-translocating membrane pyrophosphatase